MSNALLVKSQNKLDFDPSDRTNIYFSNLFEFVLNVVFLLHSYCNITW